MHQKFDDQAKVEVNMVPIRGANVWAKVIAINYYGDSLESEIGNGASILLVPDSPITV